METIYPSQIRPNASHGLWMMFLLPGVVLKSAVNHAFILTENYELWVVFFIGMILKSIVYCQRILSGNKSIRHNILNILIFFITSLLFLATDRGICFSLYSGYCATFLYDIVYVKLLEYFPRSFTLGELSIVSQSVTLFVYTFSVNFYNALFLESVITKMTAATLIIQIGLMALGLIALTTYKFEITEPTPFYTMVLGYFIFFVTYPLSFILETDPVLWISNLILEDFATMKLVLYWSFCTGIATLAVNKQILSSKKASTSIRKVFHLLAVVVYIPGLISRCTFLYLASGVVLGIFLALEILRIQNVPPAGQRLQEGFIIFSDEKDAGILALTPIYLLVGCSIPLWIHPVPCDVTDSTSFTLLPLMSGVLSIGIGDSAASLVGSKYGRHKWKGSNKSMEGTLACILSQALLIGSLMYFGYLPNIKSQQLWIISAAIFTSAIVEAKTDQVDNIVLPLIMFGILI